VQNDDAVKVVVGHNFDEIVLDDSKDVLLEVGFHTLLLSIVCSWPICSRF